MLYDHSLQQSSRSPAVAYAKHTRPSLISTDSCTIFSFQYTEHGDRNSQLDAPGQLSAYQDHLPYAGDPEIQELSGDSVVGRKKLGLSGPREN